MNDVSLAITASDRAFSIAIRKADGSIVTAAPDGTNATDLTAVIADAFGREGFEPTDLTELRLDLGPGSYTGLRVAVTFARVTASFQGIPVLTATSLEMMALAAIRADQVASGTVVRPVLDARRHRYHHAPIQTGAIIELAAPPRASELDELTASVESGEVLLASPTIHEVLSPIAAARDAGLLPPTDWDAGLLFDSGLALRVTPHAELEPLYLMGSYAE